MICKLLGEGNLGIQSLVTRMEALIASHIARLLLGPDSMWSLMMKAIYGLGSISVEIRARQSSSIIWREIDARALEVTS